MREHNVYNMMMEKRRLAHMAENRLKSLASLDYYPLLESRSRSLIFSAWLTCGLGALYYCYEYFCEYATVS